MGEESLIKTEIVNNSFVIRMNSVVITEQFIDEMNEVLNNVDETAKSVVFISNSKNIFLAGADLTHMYKHIDDEHEMQKMIEKGQNLFNRIESISVPTIAAIDGACLGGGYELSLACDYRIAANNKSTKIGLPEVNLGILPAWGGSTRLPRLIGVISSLKVILGGAQNSAKYAKKLGLVDKLVHGENLERIATSIDLSKFKRNKPFINNPLNFFIFNKAKSNVIKKTAGNYPAPLEIIKVIKKSCKVNVSESLQLEQEAFLKLSKTIHCKNLIRIFFLQEKSKKLKYSNETNRKPSLHKHNIDPINNVCVLGAGTMGAGIAQWLCSRGLNVLLKDINNEAISNGLKTIGDLFVSGVRAHKLDRPSVRDSLARLTSTTSNNVDLSNQDLIIEAIVENLEVKQKVLSDIESKCSNNTILATNTSALSIDDMAKGLKRPENLIGIHFFNPVSKMKLVEIVVGSKTSESTVKRAVKMVQKIAKLPVVVKDSPGFVVNRILMPYLISAAWHYEDGVDPTAVDKQIVKWGMPMGPYRLMDEIGLDVCLHVANDLKNRLGLSIPSILQEKVHAGELGKKTNKGFYTYKNGKSVKSKSDETIPTSVIGDITSSMLVEAEKVLKEGVAEDADWIDFAMIMGTGFAPFKGGPLKYRESLKLV